MLANHLSGSMDRKVSDRTGLDGSFNFALDYMRDGTMAGEAESNRRMQELMATVRPPQEPTPAASAANGPTIFQAVGKLGLIGIAAPAALPMLVIAGMQLPLQSIVAKVLKTLV